MASILRHLLAFAGVAVSLTHAASGSPQINGILLGSSGILLAAEALGSHLAKALGAKTDVSIAHGLMDAAKLFESDPPAAPLPGTLNSPFGQS
ncbi:MAG: hypothetical protein ACYDC0_16260 [Acidimicrobiales bacterium]